MNIQKEINNLFLSQEYQFLTLYNWLSLKPQVAQTCIDNFKKYLGDKVILQHNDGTQTEFSINILENNFSDKESEDIKRTFEIFLRRSLLVESVIKIDEYIIEMGYVARDKNGRIFPDIKNINITPSEINKINEIRQLRHNIIHPYQKNLPKASYATFKRKIIIVADILSKITKHDNPN